MSVINNPFHIGLMRSRVTFRKNNPIANTSGGYDDNYIILLSTRGWLQKTRGSVNLLTGQIVLNRDYTLICRFQSSIQVDVDVSIIVDGEDFAMKDFEIVDQIKHLYKFNITKDV